MRNLPIILMAICFLIITSIIGYFLLTQTGRTPSESDYTVKAGAILFLNPQTQSLEVGETFKIDIILDTANKPVDGVDIYSLHYNPKVFQVVDDIPSQAGIQIMPGTIILNNAVNLVDQAKGTIIFSQITAGGQTFTGKGILATIHFKAVGKGSSDLKFDFSKGNTIDTNVAYGGQDQLSKVIDATYTVK